MAEQLMLHSNGELDEETVAWLMGLYRERWEEIRDTLEKAKAKGAQDIIDRITRENWSAITSRLKRVQKHTGSVAVSSSKYRERCDKLAGRTSGNATQCAQCRSLGEIEALAECVARTNAAITEALPLIAQIDEYKEMKEELSLEKALAFKDEMYDMFVDLKSLEKEYTERYQALDRAYKRNMKICAGGN